MPHTTSRRSFIKKTTTAAAAATALSRTIAVGAYAGGSDTIKVALVGCGGRGTGAVSQIFNTKGNTKLVAVADAFRNKAEGTVRNLTKQAAEKVDVPPERIFDGLDAYKKAIDSGCDLVVIATPPGFKPQQFEYAVKQGKHIFMEKPVAADAPGVRRCLAAVEESKKKNLMVAIGLQRRHEGRYIETVKRIQDGAIGDVTAMRVYWNGGSIWYRNDYKDENQLKFQSNNWYHFIWAGADQICEQHIHNIDVGCWVKGMYPIEANGMGGNGRRLDGRGEQSQIYDHTFVEYVFPDGARMWSQGRHLKNAYNNVSEFAHGTKGVADPSGWIMPYGGQRERIKGGGGGHQQEQHDLIEALMRGEIYNEGEYGVKSTFAAILGREACYSGKSIKWDDLLAKGKDYAPGIDNWTWDTTPPVVRGSDGTYPVPQPGEWNPFEA